MTSMPPLAHPAQPQRPLVLSVQAQAIVDHLCVIKDEAELRQVNTAQQRPGACRAALGRTRWCRLGGGCCRLCDQLHHLHAACAAGRVLATFPVCRMLPAQLIADDNEIGGSHRVQLSEIQRILTSVGEYFSKAGKCLLTS